MIFTLFCTVIGSSSSLADDIRFPDDPHVVDVRKHCGAVGDGKADDTAAIQKGIDLSCGWDGGKSKVLWLPNGTYRLTAGLVAKKPIGPWLYGQSRDGVVLKLDDGVKGVTAVLRTHPNESGPTSADWFMRNLRHFTIDVGNNPSVDGIRYFATNSGILKDVRIKGRGAIGINSGFLGQNGPNLIQDVEIDGFETGILSQWIWGQTLSRVTIRNGRKVGLSITANTVAAEGLTIDNVPEPIRIEIPNDWYWWGGALALHGATITGDRPDGTAIFNNSVLAAFNVKTKGYQHSIRSPNVPNRDVTDRDVREYVSGETRTLHGSKAGFLNLPVKPEPIVPWESDPAKWECVNDHGAIAGDNRDDTAAIQKAIDAAAKAGKTTVYFRGIGGPDPNWYTLDGTVRVHGSVRHILALGFGRLLGKKDEGRIVIDDRSAQAVKVQHIDSFGGPPIVVENASKANALVIESCGVKVVGSGSGTVFMTDCPSLLTLSHPQSAAWCRHFNPEGDSDVGLVQNNGGTLWVLGMKSEGKGIKVRTANGGRSEILGTFMYGPGVKEDDLRPIFDVIDGDLSLLGLREIAFAGHTYRTKVRVTKAGETKSIGLEPGHGWIGWPSFQTRTTTPK